MTSHPHDYPSENVRERAKELLEYARTMKDPELRREVENIAEAYERLANRLARWKDAKDDGERQKPGAATCSAKRVLFSGQENNSSVSAFNERAECPPQEFCSAAHGRCVAIFFWAVGISNLNP